ncbi:hypothetical protein V1278_002991 [Bradyrhizobium sp. AZCC 1577]
MTGLLAGVVELADTGPAPATPGTCARRCATKLR